MSYMSSPHFHDEEAAYAWVEARVWPHGPTCPRCQERERVGKLKGKSTRIGVYKCYKCRKPFTVKIGTIFESSHLPLNLWLQAIYLLAASKKGISTHQLHRVLGITLKSAWFLSHRIREAMRSGKLGPMGGGGGIVEIDETYVGTSDKARKERARDKKRGRKTVFRGGAHKVAVLTLVDRAGSARSFKIDRADKATVLPILRANLDKEARVITDDGAIYHDLDREYAHAFVPHKDRVWGRGEIHTNTIEGYFSVFKRGMRGVYQHCSEKHLHRYMAEFDFRYSNRARLGVDDEQRFANIVQGVSGKRLTYRTSDRKVTDGQEANGLQG